VISPASQSGRRSFATRSGRRETDMLAESVLVCNDPKDTMIRGIYVRLDRCQAKGAIKRWDVM